MRIAFLFPFMYSRSKLVLLATCSFLVFTGAFSGRARAQELSNETVVSFPPETVRLEFVRLSRLRELPSYAALREKYTSERLASLQTSLAELGIRDADIDQIVLAWQPIGELTSANGEPAAVSPLDLDQDGGMIQNRWPTLFGGMAAGRFDWKAIAKNAAEKSIPSTVVDESEAFCVRGESPACVVSLQNSLGAFGSQKSLKDILDARTGRGSNLISSPRLVKLLQDIPREASIWGIAIGPGIADWFQGWDLSQGTAQLDWKAVFKPVKTLQYSVAVGDKIHLTVKLDCTTSEAAATLTQAFRGLQILQGWMWKKQNPNRPNPVKAMEINSSGDQVVITLTSAEDALRDSSPFSAQVDPK
jgi:hypothetical protein